METERRKHVRFLPKVRACAVLGDKHFKVGMIIDISKGGLSFGVVIDDDTKPELEVEILLLDNGFCLSKIPCTIAHNMPVSLNNRKLEFASTFLKKRYGLQFGKLTDVQEEQLKYFLENHCKGTAVE